MDVITFIQGSLTQAYERLTGSAEGMTAAQLQWRPAPQANPAGFILWHVARMEDRRVALLSGARELWEEQGWNTRLDYAPQGTGIGFTQEQVGSFVIRDPAGLLAYLNAVHERTLAYVSGLKPWALDRLPDPADPQRTVATHLRLLITHKNSHHGQVDYLRGLQQQGWQLPPTTGAVQRG